MEGRIHVAVFMNQKGISVERERPIERGRGGGGEAWRISLWRLYVYNDDANFKEAYRACSSPARNILSASLAFRAGHQTLLLPATKRFTPFQTRCSAPTARQPNGKQTERKEEEREGERERERGRKEAPAEEPFPVEIYAAGNSAIKQRYAIYLSR